MVNRTEVSKVMKAMARKRWRNTDPNVRSEIGRATAEARWQHKRKERTELREHLLSRLQQINTKLTGVVGLAENDVILTPQSLATLLQIPETTVRELTRKRAQERDRYPLPFFKVGKRVRFNKTEVLAWLTKLEAARKS